MSYEQTISQHYAHGSLLNAIQNAIPKLGKTVENITIDDLGPVDEFHIGGRIATNNLLEQLNFSEKDHILDVGCGLGGASRYIANKYHNHVSGIDLTQEYIDTGEALCKWVGLDKQVSLHHGSALAMNFKDESFDGALMLHVGMNIEDKLQLFKEVYRVLRPGTFFGIYDIMRSNDGELTYPVPWASDKTTSKLSTAEEYKNALIESGFVIATNNNRRDFALEFFKQLKAKTEANGGPAPLGLHTLMQESTPAKIKNMIDNISANLISPNEIIAQKI